MKLILSLITTLMLAVFLTACTGCTTTPTSPGQTVGCAVESTVSGALAASLAATLQCSNLAVIQTSLMGALGGANLCPAAAVQAQFKLKGLKLRADKGVIGNLVCPLALDAVMGLIGTQVPAAWGCASPSSTSLTGVLTSACEAVVPI